MNFDLCEKRNRKVKIFSCVNSIKIMLNSPSSNLKQFKKKTSYLTINAKTNFKSINIKFLLEKKKSILIDLLTTKKTYYL